MFPRYRFLTNESLPPPTSPVDKTADTDEKKRQPESTRSVSPSNGIGEVDILPRTYRQKIALVHYFPDDQTTWFQYFRRPFFLFAFPNIVLAGIQFAFGCTAGIVSFNTISEILTEAPYNFSAGSTGLVFLAALVGNFIGYVGPSFLIYRQDLANSVTEWASDTSPTGSSYISPAATRGTRSPRCVCGRRSSRSSSPPSGTSPTAGARKRATTGCPLPSGCAA